MLTEVTHVCDFFCRYLINSNVFSLEQVVKFKGILRSTLLKKYKQFSWDKDYPLKGNACRAIMVLKSTLDPILLIAGYESGLLNLESKIMNLSSSNLSNFTNTVVISSPNNQNKNIKEQILQNTNELKINLQKEGVIEKKNEKSIKIPFEVYKNIFLTKGELVIWCDPGSVAYSIEDGQIITLFDVETKKLKGNSSKEGTLGYNNEASTHYLTVSNLRGNTPSPSFDSSSVSSISSTNTADNSRNHRMESNNNKKKENNGKSTKKYEKAKNNINNNNNNHFYNTKTKANSKPNHIKPSQNQINTTNTTAIKPKGHSPKPSPKSLSKVKNSKYNNSPNGSSNIPKTVTTSTVVTSPIIKNQFNNENNNLKKINNNTNVNNKKNKMNSVMEDKRVKSPTRFFKNKELSRSILTAMPNNNEKKMNFSFGKNITPSWMKTDNQESSNYKNYSSDLTKKHNNLKNSHVPMTTGGFYSNKSKLNFSKSQSNYNSSPSSSTSSSSTYSSLNNGHSGTYPFLELLSRSTVIV